MVLDDTRKGSGAADGRYPTWQLRMPHKGVPTNNHTVGLSEADERISSAEIEIALA